jgi:hypothetical protein
MTEEIEMVAHTTADFFHSPEFKEAYAAFVEAQAEFTPVPKNKTAKVKGRTKTGTDYEYSYKYADLADVLAMALPVLTRHGLGLLQPNLMVDGRLRVCTRLLHKSGQWLQSYGLMLPENMAPQEFGSISTYWRRYDVCSLLGIAADEDVDAQGTGQGTGQKTGEGRAPAAQSRAVRQPAAANAPTAPTLSAGEQLLARRDEMVEKLTALVPDRKELGHRAKLMFPEHKTTKTLTVIDLENLYETLLREKADEERLEEPKLAAPTPTKEPAKPAPEPRTGFPADIPADVAAMFDEGKLTTAGQLRGRTIGKGLAQRLHKLIGIHKIHTEEELMEVYLKPSGLEHVSDLPYDLYDTLCAWAEGKLEEGTSGDGAE